MARYLSSQTHRTQISHLESKRNLLTVAQHTFRRERVGAREAGHAKDPRTAQGPSRRRTRCKANAPTRPTHAAASYPHNRLGAVRGPSKCFWLWNRRTVRICKVGPWWLGKRTPAGTASGLVQRRPGCCSPAHRRSDESRLRTQGGSPRRQSIPAEKTCEGVQGQGRW